MRRPVRRAVAVAMGTALLLVAGCSSDKGGDTLQTIEPAGPAQSPPVTATPAGVVQPIGRAIEAITFDPVTTTTALLTDGSTRVLLLNGSDPAAPPREIALDGAAAQAVRGADGTLLLPMNQQVTRLDLRTGDAARVAIDGDARSAADLGDGRLAVGLADGETRILGPDGAVSQSIPGLASVDALAVTGNALTALDRHQTSLTQLNLQDGSLGLALRAGEGATELATDHFGRILVTDTTGNELLVYTTDPLMLRQRFPTAPAPFGVTYDDRSDLVWVTLTGSNEVVGYDLSTGIPVEKSRYRTVHQPNSVAVDGTTGELLVGSAAGDGLQRIRTGGD